MSRRTSGRTQVQDDPTQGVQRGPRGAREAKVFQQKRLRPQACNDNIRSQSSVVGAAALNLKKTAKIWPAISCSIERSYRILTARSTLTAKSTWFWRRYRPGLTQKTSLVPTMPSYFGVCPDKVNPCCLTYTSMNVQHLDCLRYFHENGSTSGKEITLRGTWDVASLLLCQTESLKRQSQKGDTRPSAEISRPADTTVVPPRPTTCQKTLSSTGIQTDPIQGVIQRDACSGTVSQSSRPDVRTSKDLADYLAEMRLS